MADEKRVPQGLSGTPYEKIVEELDAVVQRLERGELSLEASLEAFERGVQLAAAAEARLEQAEQRVEVLMQGERTAPLVAESSRPQAPEAAEEDIPF